MADNEQKEMQLRRLALLLMAQIPDDPTDAIKVLEYAAELVKGFVVGGVAASEGRGTLHSLRIVRAEPGRKPEQIGG